MVGTLHFSFSYSVLTLGQGALIAGDFADLYGRRTTIVGSCVLFLVGVALQIASAGLSLLVAGRIVAGLGVGGVSAVLIIYMSEIAPRKVRGAIVSGYQFFITVGKFYIYLPLLKSSSTKGV